MYFTSHLCCFHQPSYVGLTIVILYWTSWLPALQTRYTLLSCYSRHDLINKLSRSVRCAPAGFLTVPRARLAMSGSHSVVFAGPGVWNILALSLRIMGTLHTFWSGLKVYLGNTYCNKFNITASPLRVLFVFMEMCSVMCECLIVLPFLCHYYALAYISCKESWSNLYVVKWAR